MRARGVAVCALMLWVACGGSKAPAPARPDGAVAAASSGPTSTPKPGPDTSGLSLTLRALKAGAAQPEKVRLDEGTPLDAKATAGLWRGVPYLKGETGDQVDFAKRPLLPAPTAAKVSDEPFPAKKASTDARGAVEKKPLEIVRIAPTGEAKLVRELSVTFNQPMVPLTSHAQSVDKGVPLSISPLPKGHFRWIGTSTLLFTAEPRFPMATEFTITVPKGARAESGAVLGEAKTVKLRTPELSLVRGLPPDEGSESAEKQGLNPLILLAFDQKVQPEKLLASLLLEAHGKKVGLRFANENEIQGDAQVKSTLEQLSSDGMRDHAVVVTPVAALPERAEVVVTLVKGCAASEGPIGTSQNIKRSFHTFGTFALEKVSCTDRPHCRPGSGAVLSFSNPLSSEQFDASWFRLEPAAEFTASPGGSEVYLQAETKPRTRYRVFVSPKARDVFGHELGSEASGTFEVGDATPELAQLPPFLMLDGEAKTRSIDIDSLNVNELSVSVRKVSARDFVAFQRARAQRGDRGQAPQLPGTKVFEKVYSLRDRQNQRVITGIDLTPALTNGLGHAIVSVEPKPIRGTDFNLEPIVTWVQVSKLGLDAFWDHNQLFVWSTALSNGTPQKDVSVALMPDNARANSNADGLAKLDLPSMAAQEVRVLVAEQKGDVAILPEHVWGAYAGGNWTKQLGRATLQAFITDDRGLYKPGETVHVKGWLRVIEADHSGAPQLPNDTVSGLDYEVQGADGQAFAKGSSKLNDQGGFDLTFALPKLMRLGQASIHIGARTTVQVANNEIWHGFEVQEYRRPEYEVTLTKDTATHFAGAPLSVTAQARYHAGGGLADAETHWDVSARDAHFSPPGHDGFTFGEQPFWWDFRWPGRGGPETHETLSGRTDDKGDFLLEITPQRSEPAFVHELSIDVSVQDLSRQNFAAHSTLLVHPAALYLGLRTEKSFTQVGDELVVESIVSDLDGKLVAGRPVTISLIEQTSRFEKGEYKSEEHELEHCSLSSSDGTQKCTLHPPRAGSYRILGRVADAQDRPSDTRLRHWVSGEGPEPVALMQQGSIELISDKQHYAPGDSAKILVRSPLSPADALVRVVHDDFVEVQRVHLASATQSFTVPLGEQHIPGVQVSVAIVGSELKDGVQRPARAVGNVTLDVSYEARRLKVTPHAEHTTLEPGAKNNLSVTVQDAQGQPIKNADVALIVVDEAILQMLEHEELDPLKTMHPGAALFSGDMSARDYLLSAQTKQSPGANYRKNGHGAVRMSSNMLMEAAAPPMAMAARDAGGGAGAAPSVHIRKLFEPLALFAASLRSDGQGVVKASVTMPDTLTRYRVLALAAAGKDHFGKGESSITVQKSLMLRPSFARFVNLGDELALPVLVQNQGDQPLEVDVGLRVSNFELSGAREKRIKVPAHDRVEVRFKGHTQRPGTVRVQLMARSGALQDATELSLPALTPATDEAFATYGDLNGDGAAAQSLAVPTDVASSFGGLELSLSSTQLSALTDSVLCVLDSQYDLPEQSASRILTILALRDVLAAFGAPELPERAALDGVVAHEIAQLAGQMRYDGGFAFYDARTESEPFVSLHVAHALAAARKAGLALPPELVEGVQRYLANFPALELKDVPQDAQISLFAYGAYTQLAWGGDTSTLAERAVSRAHGKALPVDATGWLLPVFQAQHNAARVTELVRSVQNRVSETAAAAEIIEEARDGRFVILGSEKRSNAIVLEGLVSTETLPDLSIKLARGLLAAQHQGRWQGMQENVFSLLAMRAFFDHFEHDVPRFSARAFVDNVLAADSRFEGRTTKQATTRVPMSWLLGHGAGKVTLDKHGEGRLYYRLALNYAPKEFMLSPADHGFVVERSYESVDAPSDVSRDAQGVWHVRAGARLRVTVTMVAPARRHHVALVDALPAGFEAINPALAVSEKLPDSGREMPIPMARIWFGSWFDYQDLRDERVEAHASELEGGVYTYSYYARATSPGTFLAPPAKAEELYAPETFGRGETARVVVE